jgi:hypothetical protein
MADTVTNISLGDDGSAWCVDTSGRLWFWSGVSWTQLNPGTKGKQVAAGNNQNAWYINDNGDAFQRQVDRWAAVNQTYGGKNLLWVDVSADGTVWAIDKTQQIWARSGTVWNQPNPTARAVQISVGSKQQVWCININGEAYQRQVDRWVQPDQKVRAKNISVGTDGTVMYINKTDGHIYKKTGSTWTVEPRGSFLQVAVRNANQWWALSLGGEIWAMLNGTFSKVKSPDFPVKRTYTVKRGDTLSGIATALKINYAALVKANPQILNPNFIREGDVLNLPEV